MKLRSPISVARGRRKRSITWRDETPPRSARDFKAMNKRPLLTVELKNDAPSEALTCWTAGSARTMSSARRCNSLIFSKLTSAEACVETVISPVSSSGTNPFGTTI